mmetsp:Transcript_24476/g.49676  ORF Transcript_24476/g.49676 Transcript_24476/m.49676 type:complete len:212 (-) Transcript_24476:712-1347(-)
MCGNGGCVKQSRSALLRPLLRLELSSSPRSAEPSRRILRRMRSRAQRDRLACRLSKLLPIFICRHSPKASLSGAERRMKVPLELSRSCSQNWLPLWMISACSPDTEWSGMTTSLCSVNRPSDAVLWLAKLTQCLSRSARWLDHDSSSNAGGRIIIACAFSGYFALQMEQCVLTAEEPSGCIHRCRQLRCTNFTEPWHWHGLISGLSASPGS